MIFYVISLKICVSQTKGYHIPQRRTCVERAEHSLELKKQRQWLYYCKNLLQPSHVSISCFAFCTIIVDIVQSVFQNVFNHTLHLANDSKRNVKLKNNVYTSISLSYKWKIKTSKSIPYNTIQIGLNHCNKLNMYFWYTTLKNVNLLTVNVTQNSKNQQKDLPRTKKKGRVRNKHNKYLIQDVPTK